MNQVSFLYYRGRPLEVITTKTGQYIIKNIPVWLKEMLEADIKAGKVKIPA